VPSPELRWPTAYFLSEKISLRRGSEPGSIERRNLAFPRCRPLSPSVAPLRDEWRTGASGYGVVRKAEARQP
jgi:hypothetical protein